MEMLLSVVALLALTVLLWLNALAIFVLRHDHTLETSQKIAQAFIVLLVPFAGAGLVLHLVVEHHPNAIPHNWIPWPFRKMVFGDSRKPNKERDENEIDYLGGRGHSNRESHHDNDSD